MEAQAQEESGFKSGYAETLGVPRRAQRRLCTDLRIVSHVFRLETQMLTWFTELGLTELKTRAFEAGVFCFPLSLPSP